MNATTADQELKQTQHKQDVNFAQLELTLLDLENANNVLWELFLPLLERPNAKFADAEPNQMLTTLIVWNALLVSIPLKEGIANHAHQVQCLLPSDNVNVTIADQELKQIQHKQDANFAQLEPTLLDLENVCLAH